MKKYGKWQYNEKSRTLGYKVKNGYFYAFNLENITSSAQMLDWIMQINGKVWGKGQCVADLVEAFDDIFDPQDSLCSFGNDKRINPKTFWPR